MFSLDKPAQEPSVSLFPFAQNSIVNESVLSKSILSASGIEHWSSVPSKSQAFPIFPSTKSPEVIVPCDVPSLLLDVLSWACGAVPDGSSFKCHTPT
ncbi:MAG: hypothetical protein ACTSR2_02110 [Candidatus Hodarchaeales archaeon]